jgi:hypothetical protein
MLLDLRMVIMTLTVNFTVLLHVTPCTTVNRFPSFLVNVLPLSSRSKLNAAWFLQNVVTKLLASCSTIEQFSVIYVVHY